MDEAKKLIVLEQENEELKRELTPVVKDKSHISHIQN